MTPDEPEVCERCKGEGSVRVRDTLGFWHTEPCIKCHGTGTKEE